MSPAAVAILFLVGLLAFWLLGGFVARVGGFLLVFTGAANLTLGPQMEAVVLIGIGAALRLLGHWALRAAPPGLQEPAGAPRLLPLGAGLARPDPQLGGPYGTGGR